MMSVPELGAVTEPESQRAVIFSRGRGGGRDDHPAE